MSIALDIVDKEIGLSQSDKKEFRELRERVFNMVVFRTRKLFSTFKSEGITLKSPKAREFEKLLEKNLGKISTDYLVLLQDMMKILTREDIILKSTITIGKFPSELCAMAAFVPTLNENMHNYTIGKMILAYNTTEAFKSSALNTGNNFHPFIHANREATPEEILEFVNGITLRHLKDVFSKHLKAFGF